MVVYKDSSFPKVGVPFFGGGRVWGRGMVLTSFSRSLKVHSMSELRQIRFVG